MPYASSSRSVMPSATKAAQVSINRVTPSQCRVVLDNPPLDLIGPEFVLQIREIVTELENDDAVKVVVFESAVDGVFLNPSDFLANFAKKARPSRTISSSSFDSNVTLMFASTALVGAFTGRVGGGCPDHPPAPAVCALPKLVASSEKATRPDLSRARICSTREAGRTSRVREFAPHSRTALGGACPSRVPGRALRVRERVSANAANPGRERRSAPA